MERKPGLLRIPSSCSYSLGSPNLMVVARYSLYDREMWRDASTGSNLLSSMSLSPDLDALTVLEVDVSEQALDGKRGHYVASSHEGL